MSLENDKTLKVYEKVAKNYLESTTKADSLYKKEAKRTKLKLEKIIKETFELLPKGSKILEVGSGSGGLAKYIDSLGFNITPSDIAKDFLNEIKNKGLDPIKFNILKDKFKGKYMAILCWRVFVHFTKEDTLNALKRSYDALDNNGLFIFSVIDRNCKNVDSEWIDFPDVYHLGDERFFKYYSKEELNNIISETKFEIFDYKEIDVENGIKWLVYVLKKVNYDK